MNEVELTLIDFARIIIPRLQSLDLQGHHQINVVRILYHGNQIQAPLNHSTEFNVHA